LHALDERSAARSESRRDSAPRGWPLAAALIALVAIVLRFRRLGWGLADGSPFPDELIYWGRPLSAFHPLSWAAFLPDMLEYPSLQLILSGLAWAAARTSGVASLLGPEPTSMILIGRAVAAAASVATVALVGALAWREHSPRAGLAAAALMAVVPLEVMQPRYLSADNLLAAMTAASLLAACRLAGGGGAGAALAAGLAVGLATSAKYTGAVVGAATLYAVLHRHLRERSSRRTVALLAVVGLGVAVGLFLGCPRCATRPDLALAAIRLHGERVSGSPEAFVNNWLAPGLGWIGTPFVYQLAASLPYALGWPVYLVALAGVALAVRRRTTADRVVLVQLATYLLAVGWSRVAFPRYVLPLVPGLMVLAGRFAADASPRPRLRRALIAGAWCYTLLLATAQVGRFSLEQQKGVVRWLVERKAELASAGGETFRVAHPATLPAYLKLDGFLRNAGLPPVTVPWHRWFEQRPEAIVVSDWFATSIRRDRPGGPQERNLERLESGAAGYRRAARWRSTYPGELLYTALDPAFQADVWQGEVGFTVYLREDVARRLLPAQRALPAASPRPDPRGRRRTPARRRCAPRAARLRHRRDRRARARRRASRPLRAPCTRTRVRGSWRDGRPCRWRAGRACTRRLAPRRWRAR